MRSSIGGRSRWSWPRGKWRACALTAWHLLPSMAPHSPDPSASGWHNRVPARQTCRRSGRVSRRQGASVVWSGRRCCNSHSRSTWRGGSCSRRRLARRREREPDLSSCQRAPGWDAGRPVAAAGRRGQPRVARARASPQGSMQRTGCFAELSSSRRAGKRRSS